MSLLFCSVNLKGMLALLSGESRCWEELVRGLGSLG